MNHKISELKTHCVIKKKILIKFYFLRNLLCALFIGTTTLCLFPNVGQKEAPATSVNTTYI